MESISLTKAFVAFRSEAIDIKKTKRAGKETDKWSYMYAPIEEILRGTHEALKKHKLAVTQFVEMSEQLVTVKTRLVHESGEQWESVSQVRAVADIKANGANITYLRRYALAGILGVAADDDNDEAKPDADKKKLDIEQEKPETPKPVNEDDKPLSKAGQDKLLALATSVQCDRGELDEIIRAAGGQSLATITKGQSVFVAGRLREELDEGAAF